MKILIVMTGFFPGQKFGGPPVSVDNFCTLMNEHDCYIVTRNHDMGDTEVYHNIQPGWNQRRNCKVLYLSDKEYCYKNYEKVINDIKPDIIYLQGLFQNCIIPCLFLAKKYKISVVLAPRGELCAGAFKKKYKKVPYIIFLKVFQLLNKVHFQSTSDEETEATVKYLNVEKERVDLLSNIPSVPISKNIAIEKKSGQAKLIFLSRIVSKKNLLSVIEYMFNIEGNVQVDIYGALEDEEYWNACKKKINLLPDNINVEYKGLVSHEQVHDTFRKYDAFIFPTLSENFGHVIAEALMVGCPVIISDQTPWSDVADVEGGWSIALENSEKYIQAIQEIVDADKEKEKMFKENILKYIEKKMNLKELKDKYNSCLKKAVMENK